MTNAHVVIAAYWAAAEARDWDTFGMLLADWTFADPWLTHGADPRHDLDMTSTSLVKTCERGRDTTYSGLPWEPKQAFGAVASFYADH